MLQSSSSISSSERTSALRELARFLKTLVVACVLPSVLVIAALLFLAHRMGFTISPLTIAHMQQADPRILWMSHGGYYGPYQLARIEASRPEIIFLGHSRCSPWRSMMFKPYSFHNACLTAWTFSQIRTMVDLATRKNGPRIVMFTMDYFMFNDAYAKNWADRATMIYDFDYVQGLRDLATIAKGYQLEVLTAMRAYLFARAHSMLDGMYLLVFGAVIARAGFRFDGSVMYNAKFREEAPRNVHEMAMVIPTVPRGTGHVISSAQIDELQKLADLGKERNLTLVGIQLPFVKKVADILDSGQDYQHYLASDAGVWRDFQSAEIRRRFQEMGIHFFDWSRHPIGADTRAFIDPAHSSEYANVSALSSAMADPKFRAIIPELDMQALGHALREAERTGTFFDIYHDRF